MIGEATGSAKAQRCGPAFSSQKAPGVHGVTEPSKKGAQAAGQQQVSVQKGCGQDEMHTFVQEDWLTLSPGQPCDP